MATNQKQASIARTVGFNSKGFNYTAFLHASTGNIIQEYDSEGNYYPEITNQDPQRVVFTATSSRSQGVVVPDSITYKVGGTELTFNSSGICTAPAAAVSYFKKDGADLLIIGNIAAYLGNVSSCLEAFAKKGDDDLYAYCPIDISERQGGLKKKVSIAPGDSKNFTFTSQDDSLKVRAGILGKSGWLYNVASYKYHWEIADPSEASGWKTLAIGTGTAGTQIINAAQVNTYANIRVTVYPNIITDSQINSGVVPTAAVIGTDCVGLLDASDPLDIIVSTKINKTGTGAEVAAEEDALDDTMPDNAYLVMEPTLVVRGQTTSAGATTWLNGILVDPAGVTTRNVIPSGGKYKIFVSDVKSSYGKHTIVLTGKLS